MSKLDDNMDWELEMPHLAGLSRQTPFLTPENYFKELPENINNSVFLSGLKGIEHTGFSVPSNYFDDLSTQIEGRLAVESLKNLVSADGFATPTGYFENLNTSILNKTTQQESKPKVVKLWQTNLFKYASAACVLILMASGLYYNNYHEAEPVLTADLATENMLYDIEESVIREHIQESQNVTNVGATDAEIENYILNNLSSNDISTNL